MALVSRTMIVSPAWMMTLSVAVGACPALQEVGSSQYPTPPLTALRKVEPYTGLTIELPLGRAIVAPGSAGWLVAAPEETSAAEGSVLLVDISHRGSKLSS